LIRFAILPLLAKRGDASKSSKRINRRDRRVRRGELSFWRSQNQVFSISTLEPIDVPLRRRRKSTILRIKNYPPRELFTNPLGYWGITFKNDDSSQHSHPDSTTTLIATSTRPTPLK